MSQGKQVGAPGQDEDKCPSCFVLSRPNVIHMTDGVLCGAAGNKCLNRLNVTADAPFVVPDAVSNSRWRGIGKTRLK